MELFALNHAWLIPLVPAAAFIIIGLFFKEFHQLSAGIAVLAGTFSFIMSAAVVMAVLDAGISVEMPFIQKIQWIKIAGMHFSMGVMIDPLSAMMLVVVSLVALLVEIYSIGYMKGDKGYGRFFAYISLFSASMLGLNIAVNFLQMYVFWELVGLCSYLLIGFYYYRISAREAAKKAFITTRIGDFGLLIGILSLQMVFGTVDFMELRHILPVYIAANGTGLLTIIGILLFIGPIGKSGQFPLHVWLPDAMEGPAPVSALIHAATMVVAGVYLVARSYFLFAQLPELLHLIAWLGAFTAFFAASIAITQREIKRILAYSTISQLGYMMMALGVGSLTASMFHLLTHAFFKSLLFLGAGAVMHAINEEADIFKMGGLRKKMPLVFVTMTIGVLAISGLPPFAGFFSKDEILAAAAAVSMPLYIIGTITAFMTAFYMARLLFVVFWGKEQHGHVHKTSYFMQIPLAVLSILAAFAGAAGYVGGFGDWVRFGEAMPEHMNIGLAGISTALSVAAIALAWHIYVSKKYLSDIIAQKMGFIYTVSFNKYYIDEFYAILCRIFIDGIGKIMYFIDLYIIDGIVNTMAALTVYCSRIFSKLQTGQIQTYVAIFFCGVIILLVYTIVFFTKINELAAGGGF
ncbi:NADH-quinone oxidoreductase subunit L [Pectinatus brassicae]|uniref:NADH-quinone oxidoreductase subunit L n=1 Tax=Pectinatus brassicae TaxID=862415 RepID=A0A840UL58_9FIRM|nr:NADH-quinone oxidoreductase subunit L [Pectinatus brassicae]MBB5336477.1 NADH-quinone oxidoreductase subunit L [Pectinatus brassicae]